jgi:hypothetical protein
MTKLNRKAPNVAQPKAAQHVITTATVSTGRTFEGGAGYARDVKSELNLLAITNLGEDTFYEKAEAEPFTLRITSHRDVEFYRRHARQAGPVPFQQEGRNARFKRLIGQAAIEDPYWTLDFLRWLRTGANMRFSSVVGAIEGVKARLDAGAEDTVLNDAHLRGIWPVPRGVNRTMIDTVLTRPDEPGDATNYYTTHYGRKIPMPIKRGIADAAKRMYRDWALLKYDTASHEVRFADVLELTHPRLSEVGTDRQALVYDYALFRRHGRKPTAGVPEMIVANNEVREAVANGDYDVLLSPDILKAAGMTWEDTLSLAGNHLDKAHVWEAIIPSMGYMALLRNLRNFDQAGVSDAVAGRVAAKIADPIEVARSKQFPMRFLSAYNAVKGSLRWNMALNLALEHSLSNIPMLGGRTLILIDTSASMNDAFSKDGTLLRWDAAAIFGLALARRCAQADIVSFSTTTRRFPQVAGEALLVSLDRFRAGFMINDGTSTAQAVAAHYAAHDRVVVLTDEQATYWGGRGIDPDSVFGAVPATIPTYTWNLAGYEMGHGPGTANRHTFGGLTDASFRMIPLLDYGRSGHWPWEMAA